VSNTALRNNSLIYITLSDFTVLNNSTVVPLTKRQLLSISPLRPHILGVLILSDSSTYEDIQRQLWHLCTSLQCYTSRYHPSGRKIPWLLHARPIAFTNSKEKANWKQFIHQSLLICLNYYKQATKGKSMSSSSRLLHYSSPRVSRRVGGGRIHPNEAGICYVRWQR
jgi:hypothetical protein